MVQMRYVNKGVLNCKVDSDVIAKMVIDLEVIMYRVKVCVFVMYIHVMYISVLLMLCLGFIKGRLK